jgi:hypothetical protein
MMLNLDERAINDGRGEGDDVKRFEPERPRQTGLWVALALLLCASVAAGVYGYRALKDAGIQLAQVPGMMNSVADLSGRFRSMEQTAGAWAGDKQKLFDRLGSLERRVNASLQKAREHADTVTDQLRTQIEDEMDERAAVADGRLDKLEVAQASNQAQFAQLRTDLANARQEIASLRRSSESEFASLHRNAEQTDRAVEALGRRFDRQRIDFEVAKNRDTAIIPGVALKVTDTDVRYQQFSGWIRLLPEARFLWVNEHGIHQPVAFYRQRDSQPFDLVVTRVTAESIVGYLLKPADANQQAGAPVASLELAAPLARQED